MTTDPFFFIFIFPTLFLFLQRKRSYSIFQWRNNSVYEICPRQARAPTHLVWDPDLHSGEKQQDKGTDLDTALPMRGQEAGSKGSPHDGLFL